MTGDSDTAFAREAWAASAMVIAAGAVVLLWTLTPDTTIEWMTRVERQLAQGVMWLLLSWLVWANPMARRRIGLEVDHA